ncbi:NADPH:quinone oxidoreductase family protein [Rhodococcus ruber]|uniref:Alcohol dehydrogenase zinc-binding domain protein n=1 Tax=Rhodococcus ruber TaxID=1830 RepID=A0A098BHK9_9NOCA|nr:NADPH:quinone oxidoreductase family protein [Rhodococcus ruber]MDO2377652.1 NADPH:quinone oxidoreductase family protein [Rhodococcus ruber]MCD2129950.1 NADPH:quinone oxidoreductase family protein [Rhodococcus ruber]MCZ4506377.1 NADPH:quinone oxidoreductase family protein [Rhodococcus ruber]MCZ4533579.1 NADPH:quinone oxidoreductase family protein [Rhodococcus ruber]MCZ4623885.1 NADPH:quinone oxidoreductase family protein [Rhodococcus ruber]
MRAWQVTAIGDPVDVARIVDLPHPTLSAGQVMVKVRAVGLNLPDILLMQGRYQNHPGTSYIPGFEFAGEVVAVADDVDLPVGARVLCVPDLPHGPRGGLAEHVPIDAAAVYEIPDAMSFTDAAAMSITYVTALLAIERRGRLRSGETLLVHGGAGGVGTAAIQLGLHMGARVLATAGGGEKVAFCESLGAEAVDYRSEDFVDFVRERTAGVGADVIIDPVGGEVFERSRKAVAWEGRLLVVGFASDSIGSMKSNQLLLKNFSVIGVNRDQYRFRDPEVFRSLHREVFSLYESGAFRPVIKETVGFADVQSAWARLAGRNTIGKVVVTM